jgi:hypothetical protein
MKQCPDLSWISRRHADLSEWDGWFVAGMKLPSGMVTYHLPDSLWGTALGIGAELRPTAPEWDGHTSADVVKRFKEWIVKPNLPREGRSSATSTPAQNV